MQCTLMIAAGEQCVDGAGVKVEVVVAERTAR